MRIRPVVKRLGEVLLAFLVVLAVTLIPAKTGSTPGVEQALSNASGRQVKGYEAAGGSPLTGDTGVAAKEQDCIAKTDNPGLFKTMTPAEGIDAARTNSSPCATFTGDFDNPGRNKVLAYQAPAQVGGTILDAVTGAPEELFVYCCGSGQQAGYGVNQGHSVAKLDARTLQTQWKTVLDNYNASGQWTVLSGINYVVGPSGRPALVVSYGHRIAKLDPATGKLLADIDLPVGKGVDPTGVNFETTIPTPDGTVITKTQGRPATTTSDPSSPPCTDQGFTAMVACKGKQPDSEVVAVNPDTMEILDALTLPQQVSGRNTIGTSNGRTYIYMTGLTNEMRVQWDPDAKKLTFDKDWFPHYPEKDQTSGSAPCVLGKWVLFNTNGVPSTVSSSIVAVSQEDPKDLHRITAIPIGSAKKSFWPSKLSCDPVTNMIYQADTGVGKVAAVRLNPSTGQLTKAWGPIDQRTFGFFTLFGPRNQRVVLSTHIDVTNPLTALGVGAGVYGEQFIWRDALTGRELARSDYVDAMSQGILPTPGYGGLAYMLQSDGGIASFQVVKASA
ncbi:hypothetical protein [Streptomyces sp. NPDC096033]|uniref:hypothetical protein n=1 Tax=Streptomyces sp. NPDC096033 TaxID=3366071 RepID=UPI00380D4C5E